MNLLETAYRNDKQVENAEKVSDEADELVGQVDRETSPARMLLVSLTKTKSRPSSTVPDYEVSEKRRQIEKAELEARARKNQLEWEIEIKREALERHQKELQAVNAEVIKRRQELGGEIEEELGLVDKEKEEYYDSTAPENKDKENKGCSELPSIEKSATETVKVQLPVNGTSNKACYADSTAISTNGQLERIRLPVFSGNKMDYQKWNAAFTSCVDSTSLSPQFKMLRLEACLAGEAANTIKGLGYSLDAYEAAKARLERKYGGSRRQVQSHLEELKKLKPIRDHDAKELETLADVLERAVITLKENGRKSDLEGGTLHTMILEKIPERLLAQCYRWLKENKQEESLESLKDWVSEEAAY